MVNAASLRADTIIALEKRRFVAWLKNADPARILACGHNKPGCPLCTYLWETLVTARYPVCQIVISFSCVEVATRDYWAQTPLPAWARRFLYRLAADRSAGGRAITTEDVRRIVGV